MRYVNQQQHQQQPWTVSFRAKAKSLDFKLKSSSRLILPFFKLFRFSIQLKLHPYFLEIKSKPADSSFLSKTKYFNLKFLHIFNNLHRKRSKNRGIWRSWFAHKNYLDGRRRTNVRIWLCALLFAVIGCFIITQLIRYYFIWKYIWKARQWHNATSSALLNHFFNVILDGIFQSMGFAVPK